MYYVHIMLGLGHEPKTSTNERNKSREYFITQFWFIYLIDDDGKWFYSVSATGGGESSSITESCEWMNPGIVNLLF